VLRTPKPIIFVDETGAMNW